jgi:vacuolar protein sorting-associated protein 18
MNDKNNHKKEDPIWETRHIDWPLPLTLPSSLWSEAANYAKLTDPSNASSNSYLGFINKFLSSNSTGTVSAAATTTTTITSNSKSSTNPLNTNTDLNREKKNHLPLKKSPKVHCTAAANGTIVSVLECPSAPFHIISRWNVRRNTHSLSLLPFVGSKKTQSQNQHTNPHSASWVVAHKIQHVFLDPTGNHAFFSAKNGDFYYLHSSSKIPTKLMGFHDSYYKPGKPLDDIIPNTTTTNATTHPSTMYNTVQLGLTPHSYVTAIGWNKLEQPFEGLGTTNTILLGTNMGEIYEYNLSSLDLYESIGTTTAATSATGNTHTSISSNASTMDASSIGGGGGGGSSNSTITSHGVHGGFHSSVHKYDDRLPMLMTRLNDSEWNHHHLHHNQHHHDESNPTSTLHGGLVSGLHYEISTMTSTSTASGRESSTNDTVATMVLIAATSGINKQTRLHSFTSTIPISSSSSSHSNIFRQLFAMETHNHHNDDESANMIHKSFLELPGSIHYADLRVLNMDFALRTETGLYYGTLDHPSNSPTSTNRAVPFQKVTNGIIEAGMLPYESSTIPISIAITPYHYVTLNEMNEVHFINRVSKKVIQKERVDHIVKSSSTSTVDDGIYSGPGEILMDIRRPDQLWLRKSRTMIHVSSKWEDRDVWKFSLEACLLGTASMNRGTFGIRLNEDIYMDAEFEHTKSLCTNEARKAVVTAARAEYYLTQGRVELAAKYLAQCPPSIAPFAETAIRLALPSLIGDANITARETKKAYDALKSGNTALITYLSDKLRTGKARNDNVACTMIGAWLTELYLYEQEDSPDASFHGKKVAMQQFLSSNAYNMDAKTILGILCSHDLPASECSHFASSSGDISTAINAALSIADYKAGVLDALRVLSDAPLEQAEPFYYKHAFTLLSRAPALAVQSFLARFNDGISPTKILPALMRYERKRAEERMKYKTTSMPPLQEVDRIHAIDSFGVSAGGVEVRIDDNKSFVDDDQAVITYLKGCITLGCKSTAIFNYLVSLLVKLEDEDPLHDFLSQHIVTTISTSGGKPRQKSPLDLPYTLRLLLQSGRHFRSVIQLYMGLGMRQRAVELAIKVDPRTAKELTKDSIDQDEKKRLWLMIARNAAEDESGDNSTSNTQSVVSKVLNVLKECGPDVLSIEDVLSFLPDVAQIDEFKDEICQALTNYSTKIETYRKDMTANDAMCTSLRDEIRRLHDYTTYMDGSAKCAFTEKYVVKENEPFYVFPSGFVALESALKTQVRPYLNDAQQSRLAELEQEMKDMKSETKESGNDMEYRIKEVQSEIDGFIAAECPLTGYLMIESIEKGFECKEEDDVYVKEDNIRLDA